MNTALRCLYLSILLSKLYYTQLTTNYVISMRNNNRFSYRFYFFTSFFAFLPDLGQKTDFTIVGIHR